MGPGRKELLLAGLRGFLWVFDGDTATLWGGSEGSRGPEARPWNDAILPVGMNAQVVLSIVNLDKTFLRIKELLVAIWNRWRCIAWW